MPVLTLTYGPQQLEPSYLLYLTRADQRERDQQVSLILGAGSTSVPLDGEVALMSTANTTILVVEDDPITQVLIEDAIDNANLASSVQIVGSGIEAMRYLKGQDAYGDQERYTLPVLIITDVNMPEMTGLELLSWLKQQHELKHLPVVVMSNSDDKDQILRAMNLGASSYFVKMLSLDNLICLVKAFVP